MRDWILPYSATVQAMGATATLLLIQLVVADVAGIRARHVPGAPVPADHDSFLFRAARAFANTNETVAVFLLLALFGILNLASPAWINGCAWIYVLARAGHMLCYYADLRIPRSICFGISLLALVAMLIGGIVAIG